MQISVYYAFIFGLLHWKESYSQNVYVKGGRDYPVRLRKADFDNAKRRQNLGQPFNKKKAVNNKLLEGDIAGLTPQTLKSFLDVSNRQDDPGAFVQRSAIRNRYNLWPNKQIPYVLSSRYSQRSRTMIAEAIQDFEKRTCLKFVPRTTQRDYVYIRPDSGCYSHVGRTGSQQTLSLEDGCFQRGTIIHEMMHSAGFFHEQNRNDRDQYVTVYFQNIYRGLEGNFAKRSLAVIDHLGTPYDYGSVMHYGRDYFSRNGYATIVPKKSGVTIGQRSGFSDLDAERLNLLYKCTNQPTGPTRPTGPKPVRPPTGPTDTACYAPVNNNEFLLRVERGCYRVVKYKGEYIVSHCSRTGESAFIQTSNKNRARQGVYKARNGGMQRCRGPGKIPENRRRPVNPSPTPRPAPSTGSGGGISIGGGGGGSWSQWLNRLVGSFLSRNSDTAVPVETTQVTEAEDLK